MKFGPCDCQRFVKTLSFSPPKVAHFAGRQSGPKAAFASEQFGIENEPADQDIEPNEISSLNRAASAKYCGK
jgi:hypothetical protein